MKMYLICWQLFAAADYKGKRCQHATNGWRRNSKCCTQTTLTVRCAFRTKYLGALSHPILRRQVASTEGENRCRVGLGMGRGCPLQLIRGSSGVRCGAPARNAFWRPQYASFCTYMPMLWVRQTVFHVTVGGKTKVWGRLPPCPNIEPCLTTVTDLLHNMSYMCIW